MEKILIAIRGSPYAGLALRVAMKLEPNQLDVLHLTLPEVMEDAAFKGIKSILTQLLEANLKSMVSTDELKIISSEAEKFDLVIPGATASKRSGKPCVGVVAEKLLNDSSLSVMIVKTQYQILVSIYDESARAHAISILVDKWFAEKTFSSDEFNDLTHLMNLKEKQGVTISLALPALNEEETIGNVISTIKNFIDGSSTSVG